MFKLEGNICILGDSIVYGAWDEEKHGYVNRLREDLKENNLTCDIVPLLTKMESNAFMNWFKIKVFSRLLFKKSIWRLFLRYKGLTKEEASFY